MLAIPPSRRRASDAGRPPGSLEIALGEGDDPLLAPLRAAWLPPRGADGQRRVTLRSILLGGGDPRDPGALRQRWIAARDPARLRVVAGEPAPLSDLRRRWREAAGAHLDESVALGDFVCRQAALSLERAERALRGARYKVPHLVREDILARPSFRGGLARLARALDRRPDRVEREARADLEEIAAAHNPTMIDLAYQICRVLTRRSYERLDYDRGALERVAALSQRHPVVFLPTHKSNLDHPSLRCILHEVGLAPNHTAGGINMNFFPMGPIMRRAGLFFIRRRFKDDEVYKHVLRHYIDYLIEKRFSLEWYIEGGRSRSGKLLPPRLGLLAYVVDAYRRGKSDDVFLIPVSISFDQIQDVGDYVREQYGGKKQRESFGWFLGVVRGLRRYRAVQLSFGEPLSLAKALGAPDPTLEPDPDEESLAIQKLAFEVCVRINEVTPITATSAVTLELLGAGDQALTVGEIRESLGGLLDYVEQRGLPRRDEIDLREAAGIERALRELCRSGVLTSFEEGPEAVYRIGDDQHLAASYYRNTIIHFFVTPAIGELALLHVSEAPGDDPEASFCAAALRLRDLLKFEFFFPERERFLESLRRELSLLRRTGRAGAGPPSEARWEDALDGGSAAILALVAGLQPLSSHRVIRPFLDAYRIVADTLLHWGRDREFETSTFLEECLGLGRQYTLQRRIHSAESVSHSYFENGLRLARNRGLVEGASVADREARADFAAEVESAVRRIGVVEALAAVRRSGIAG